MAGARWGVVDAAPIGFVVEAVVFCFDYFLLDQGIPLSAGGTLAHPFGGFGTAGAAEEGYFGFGHFGSFGYICTYTGFYLNGFGYICTYTGKDDLFISGTSTDIPGNYPISFPSRSSTIRRILPSTLSNLREAMLHALNNSRFNR